LLEAASSAADRTAMSAEAEVSVPTRIFFAALASSMPRR
jgi:hypothetical protein